MLHCGRQALLAEVRRRYWPLTGRRIARIVAKMYKMCTSKSEVPYASHGATSYG